MRVAVLAGGRSSEHDVSLDSAAGVAEGLREAGHDTVEVLLERDGTWSHGGRPVPLEPGRGLLGVDAVFPVLHGPFGEDGTIQGLLEILDVPYVGAGVLASAVSMDKVVFKELMERAGVPQVRWVALREDDDQAALDALGLPVFVKPARLGSSVGISKVSAPEEMAPALELAFRHDPLVIVEAMAPGIEVECSVLGNQRPEASQPGQVVPKNDWYDYEAKYTEGGMELVVPAPVEAAVRERVRELALAAFSAAGCAGLARVDFFVDGDEVLVNELNTMPGQTKTSVYGKLWEASGVAYAELMDRLVQLALERHEHDKRYRF